MNPLLRATGASLALALVFSGISVSAAEAKKIDLKFRGGSMYTLEYSDEYPGASPTTRWGKITKTGKVVPLTDDLGLEQVTDADYSPETGLVYVLANAYTGPCELWSFNPSNPAGTLVKISNIARVGFNPTTCTSLMYTSFGEIAVTHSDYVTNVKSVSYLNRVTGAWITEDALFDQEFTAMDNDSRSGLITITQAGYVKSWNLGREGQLAIAPLSTFHSVKYDRASRPWVLYWGPNGVQVGLLDRKKSKIAWGKTLVESGTRQHWGSDTLVFIPSSR